jgi:SLT domain-containing protein
MGRQKSIPLFAKKPSHPVVPLDVQSASARSEGQGRPSAGACALPLTAASTLAGWRRSGAGSHVRHALILLVAGVLGSACPGAVMAQPEPPQRVVSNDPYAAHIAEAAQRFGIPHAWIRAVLGAESAGDPRAVSSKGAMGLMQIMPDTWADLRVRHRLGRDPFDPRDNILAGAAYIREMFDRYGSPGFLAAYNAGPARYEAALGGRPLPAETRAYVASLAPIIGGSDAAITATIDTPDPLEWTRAPIFVTRRASTSGVDHTAAELQPIGRSGADAVQDSRTIAPQSGGLFVAQMNAGTLP